MFIYLALTSDFKRGKVVRNPMWFASQCGTLDIVSDGKRPLYHILLYEIFH